MNEGRVPSRDQSDLGAVDAPERAVEAVRPLLVYDGDCGFCSASVRWLVARSHGTITAMPSEHLDLAALGLVVADTQAAAFYFDNTGARWRGERAIAHSLRRCGRWWAAVGRFLDLPGVRHVAAVVYRLVAANRHRMPGSDGTCGLPRA